MLTQAKTKASDKVIAKAILLSKKVAYNNDNTYTVPGSETPHIVTLDPDKCDCKFKGECSHILAVKFFKEAKEWEQKLDFFK